MSLSNFALSLVAAFAFAGAASAQTANTRSFVSGLGIDNSNCLMATRPCRTFAYAMNQTATGGIIVALDAAEYGTVSITRAMTILGAGPGTAKISVPAGGTGVLVQASGAAVVLRGLEIVGGYNSIDVLSVATLDIGDTVITGPSNLGLNANAAGARTTMHDCMLVGGASDGVDLNVGSLALARVVLARNAGNGVFNGGGNLDLVSSIVDGSNIGADTVGGTTVVRYTTIANSHLRGVNDDGGQTYLDTTTVVGSGQADVYNPGGAAIYSYGNNNFGTTNGTITPVAPN